MLQSAAMMAVACGRHGPVALTTLHHITLALPSMTRQATFAQLQACDIASALASLRFRSTEALQQLAAWSVAHIDSFAPRQLTALVAAFAELNFPHAALQRAAEARWLWASDHLAQVLHRRDPSAPPRSNNVLAP
jgi:hypothetical protein